MKNEPVGEIGCGIFSLSRFSYLVRLLNSLEKAEGKDDIHFYLFQDGGRNPFSGKLRAVRMAVLTSMGIFREADLPHKEIIERPHNVGIPINVYDGVEHVFKNHKIGIFLENDIVVPGDYFELILGMLEKYGGVVKAGDSPSQRKGITEKHRISGNNWSTTRKVWKETKPFLEAFISDMRKADYAEQDPTELRKKYGSPTQDCIRSLAFGKANVKIWETDQPKVRMIGEKGVHGASEQVLAVTNSQIAVKVVL